MFDPASLAVKQHIHDNSQSAKRVIFPRFVRSVRQEVQENEVIRLYAIEAIDAHAGIDPCSRSAS